MNAELLSKLFVYFSKKTCEVKGKAVPLQAWSGPEVSRNLRFPDFMTTEQEGGKFISLTHWQHFTQEILIVLISVRD